MSGYDIGEGVEVSVAFTDRNDAARDPSSWKFEKFSPAGVKTTFTYPADSAVLVHDGLGAFHYDLLFTETGTWIVRATSLDGTLPSVVEKEYFVREPRF